MDILYVVLGWALGLLSAPITRWLDRSKQRGELRSALARELRQFRLTMAIVADQLATHLVEITDGLLAKLRPALDVPDPIAEDEPGLEALRSTVSQPAETLAAAAATRKQPGTALRVRPYRLPFLESQVQRLDVLSLNVQERLMHVLAQLELYNGDVEYVMSLHERTFDSSLAPENREVVSAELEATYGRMLRRATGLVTSSTELLREVAA